MYSRGFSWKTVVLLMMLTVARSPIVRLEEADEKLVTTMPKLEGDYYNHTVDEGGNVSLTCKYDDMGSDSQILWRKNSTYIMLGKFPLDLLDGRVNLGDNYSIEISNMRRNDSGNYTCSFGIQTVMAQNHFVDVRYPASVEKVLPGKKVIGYVGFDLTLTCETDGNPKPTVMWKHSNHKHGRFTAIGESLIIHNVNHNHRGHYVCVANNGVGEAAKEDVHVEVVDVAYFPNKSIIHAKVNDTVRFECKVLQQQHHHHHDHHQVPSIRWHVNDTVMISENKEEMIIENVQVSDSGLYKCEVGASTRPFKLAVYFGEEVVQEESEVKQEKVEDNNNMNGDNDGDNDGDSSAALETTAAGKTQVVSLLTIVSLVTFLL